MQQKRVLIVDDEEDLTWSISKHLSKDQSKYQLITVNSARAALDVLSQLPVDLVVSDIRMPEISGLDLLLDIRKNYPETKVIIMTAYGSSEIQQEANDRGCFKYLEKPFEIQELRQLILDGVEEKKGFDGRISDLQLSDLIQMNCLGRLTNALNVKKDNYSGTIYFEDGNIVHTVVENDEGEEAFYEILAWEGGSFSVEKGIKAPRETILKGWQTLLLEGMRRADEKRTPEAQEFQIESQRKQRRMKELLSDFGKIKGIRLTAVFDIEGFPLSSYITRGYHDQLELSEIVPLVSKLQKQVQKIGLDFNMNHTREILIEFQDGLLKINQIAQKNAYLLLIVDDISNLGLLRMESKRYIKLIAEQL